MNEVEMRYLIKTESSFLAVIEHDFGDLLERCNESIEGKLVQRPVITLFGKNVEQPRNIGFFSNESIGYKYSHKVMLSQQLSEPLSELLNLINEMTDSNFNGILVNEYPDGTYKIGAHSDDEGGLSRNGLVVCVSFGASRKLRFKDKATKATVMDVQTRNNEILIMGGDFQKNYTHEIPQEKKVKESRISYTFRTHTK
jgi:alkylated DNA repair dioxygenase AlkB